APAAPASHAATRESQPSSVLGVVGTGRALRRARASSTASGSSGTWICAPPALPPSHPWSEGYLGRGRSIDTPSLYTNDPRNPCSSRGSDGSAFTHNVLRGQAPPCAILGYPRISMRRASLRHSEAFDEDPHRNVIAA